jgi:ribosomal protein S18 acetylase RimI-like enzyme
LHLVKIAKEKNCGRMEWSVLNWNEPAINFYESLGAKGMDEWTVYRLDNETMANLVKS